MIEMRIIFDFSYCLKQVPTFQKFWAWDNNIFRMDKKVLKMSQHGREADQETVQQNTIEET